MFKINIMPIMKFITSIFYFILAWIALCLIGKSKASPLPALICIFIPFIVDEIISHILIKKGHENSPYFDPKHQWKYGAPIDIAVFLIIIVMYRYLL